MIKRCKNCFYPEVHENKWLLCNPDNIFRDLDLVLDCNDLIRYRMPEKRTHVELDNKKQYKEYLVSQKMKKTNQFNIKCIACDLTIPKEEVYGDWYYCEICKKDYFNEGHPI